MIAIVSAVKEGGLKRHFLGKQEILKLMFAFHYIHYVGTLHTSTLNNLLRKGCEDSIVKDLIKVRHGASCSGDTFSIIHGDLVTENFKKKRKELLALSHQIVVMTFIYAVNKWMKTSHIHSRCKQCCGRNLICLPFKFIKKLHQEIKAWILSMLTALKLILSNIMSTFLETVQLEISQLVEEVIKEAIDGLSHLQKTLETNVSMLLYSSD